MKRRNFIANAAAVLTFPLLPKISFESTEKIETLLQKELPVNFIRDGLNLPPKLYLKILQILIDENGFKPDSYGLGGLIHDFEKKIAKSLDKEKAIYMPTGTLANQIALRKHCTTKKRAIVQYDSHINRDTGDSAAILSGINLITLGAKKVIFSDQELNQFLNDNLKGKVKTFIGAISLETPVRRKNLERIPFNRIKQISAIAKKNNIALHLDGARLFIDSAYSGKSVKEYTSLFDTVYLSLYKSFNSVNGAILAGPKNIITDLHNERRMFGGGLPSSWQQIYIANYFFNGYESRYRKAIEKFYKFKYALEKTNKFKIIALSNGSNIFKLIPKLNFDANAFQTNLKKKGILIPNWHKDDNCFYIKMNDSLIYNNIDDLVSVFINS